MFRNVPALLSDFYSVQRLPAVIAVMQVPEKVVIEPGFSIVILRCNNEHDIREYAERVQSIVGDDGDVQIVAGTTPKGFYIC